ncbi:hypothetical protein [Achromobacter sp. AGC39]
MQTTYHFHEDPGHAWLEVKRAELVRLNLIGQISGFSYQRGDSVYLEEDCDASLFISEKRKRGEEIRFTDSHTNHSSPIRSYDRYSAEQVPA